ncbi:MAG: adenylate kinase [Firmicutes bacterium]|nr:adenylate kinase [Bacillota bacterium]
MELVLLGPPGAGKGTQADHLAAHFGVPHISTGAIFRQNLADRTPLGLEARRYMEAGQLVPDEVTIGMVAARLQEPDARAGFILDGFPRNVAQAEALDRMLARSGVGLTAALLLEADRDLVMARLTGRRVCERCGATYHVEYHPPKVAGVCDVCGGPLVQRPDDRPETVARRLDVYEQETRPVVDYYRRRGLLVTVPAEGAENEVTRRIIAALHHRELEA